MGFGATPGRREVESCWSRIAPFASAPGFAASGRRRVVHFTSLILRPASRACVLVPPRRLCTRRPSSTGARAAEARRRTRCSRCRSFARVRIARTRSWTLARVMSESNLAPGYRAGSMDPPRHSRPIRAPRGEAPGASRGSWVESPRQRLRRRSVRLEGGLGVSGLPHGMTVAIARGPRQTLRMLAPEALARERAGPCAAGRSVVNPFDDLHRHQLARPA